MLKKIWIALLTGAAMLLGCSLSVSAAESVLHDIGDYLTEEEAAEITQQVESVAHYTDLNIGIYLDDDSIPEDSVVDTMEAMYLSAFGSDTSGVYCYIKIENGGLSFFLHTNGDAALYYADSGEDGRMSEIMYDFWLYADPAGSNSVYEGLDMLCTDLEYFYYAGPIETGTVTATEAIVSSEEETTAETEQAAQSLEDIAGGNAVLFDESGRLTPDEYAQSLEILQNAADNTGMNVAIILGTQVRSEYMIESLADESYDALFGKRTDGILYYMDLSGADSPYDYISTSGLGQFYYSDGEEADRINAIFDDVFPYLYPAGSEDIAGAIAAFAADVEYYYDMGISHNYYLYDDVDGLYYYVKDGELKSAVSKPYIDWGSVLMATFMGGVFGLIVAVIVFFSVKAHYRFKASLSPTAYVNRKNLVFHRQYDNFVREYTTRVKIESSSGGGGGSRGGGGRSSGGHGGGGRHR